jgi:hypothetical protein
VSTSALEARTLQLFDYCRRRDWKGYDPYDALNSRVWGRLPWLHSRIPRLILTQALKRSPFNVRWLLRVPGTENPKAIALFLMASRRLSRLGLVDDGVSERLTGRLLALRAHGTSYWCWGYSFPWQIRSELVPRGAPNLVCTAFVVNALLDRYETDPDPRLLDVAVSAADYLCDELFWTDGGSTAGFAYPSPSCRPQVHNANLLGAALLCRVAKYSRREKFLEPALKVARYSAACQGPDGRWDYGELPWLRWADNFHTGYNLCALRSVAESAGITEFDGTIDRGFRFYRRHFVTSAGAARYFCDRTYPIDAHNVAQSIITLLMFRDLDPANPALANTVYRWAVEHLWDERGYFYYQVGRVYTNRIPYMRWSQAWMLLALSTLLAHEGAIREAPSRDVGLTVGD